MYRCQAWLVSFVVLQRIRQHWGAAQQALQHAGHSGGPAALATAVTYPLGVVGVIFAMIFLRKFFVKPSDLVVHSGADDDHTYIGQFVVLNPAVNGKQSLR